MNGRHKRQAAHRLGLRGEWLALLWLWLKFYRLLAWRFRSPVGEIDLIMRRGGVLVFIEVKTRAEGPDMEQAAAVAHGRQGRRIMRAAGWFLARNPRLAGLDARFDLVLVRPWRLPQHLPGAISHALQGGNF